MKRSTSINSVLSPINEIPIQAYLSNEFQVADLIEWVIEQIGECELFQTSFSISEEYLRRLYFMKSKKLIKKITLILDHKATNMTVKLWVFINELVKDCFLADNHSKILLFEATNGERISIITSQNLTRGNRNESAVIISDKSIFENLKSSMLEIRDKYSVPLSELMEEAFNYDLSSNINCTESLL